MKPYIYFFVFVLFLITSAVISLWYFKKDFFSKNNLETIVAFMTIVTGIASVVVGFITIKVMLDQNTREQILLEFQEKEHQPIFIVKKTLGKSYADKDIYDYEEFTLENVGHTYKHLESVNIKTFVKISHSIMKDDYKNIISYIPLSYYYNATSKTGYVTDLVYYSHSSNYEHNNEKYSNLYFSAIDYNQKTDNEKLFVDKIQFFIIKYTDIYDKDRVIYLQDKEVVTEEIYNNIKTLAEQDYEHNTYNLSELSLDIYWNNCKQLK